MAYDQQLAAAERQREAYKAYIKELEAEVRALKQTIRTIAELAVAAAGERVQ